MSTPSPAKQRSEPQAIALLYHEVRVDTTSYSYVLPRERFEDHLRLLKGLSAKMYESIITFDDGHESDHSLAFPLLENFGVKAHFFITAGWTGTRSNYMTPQQLRDLHAAGHTIGAHGWSHAMLTACNAKELLHELRDARTALEDHISAPVTSISLPGGRGNAAVMSACLENGYTKIWTSAPGVITSDAQTVCGRFNILASHSDEFLLKLLDPNSGELKRAARVGQWKASAQRLLGDRLYARLWAMLNHEESGADAAVTQDAAQ